MPIEEPLPVTTTPSTARGTLLIWLSLIIKWKKLVWRTALAILVLGSLTALLLPNTYTATVVILPPQQGVSAAATMMAQTGAAGAMAAAAGGLMKNPNDQQIALLMTETVENAMVARFHLQDLYHSRYLSKTRKKLEHRTKTENGLKDGLLHLSVTDRDPHRAAEMANGWVEEYKRFTATLAISEASQRRLFYERQLSAAHADLVRAEEDMKQTEQRTGMIDVEGQDRSMIASAAVLRGQLAAKQIEIRAMREFAGEQNPDLQRAQQEASGLEAQLASMDAASDRKTGDLITPKGKVTQAGLDYARALREVKYRETLQDLLTRQYEGARVDEARQGALVQVVDPASVPDRPSPYKLWILLGVLLGALPLSLLTAPVAEIAAILHRSRRRSASWAAALEDAIAGAAQ